MTQQEQDEERASFDRYMAAIREAQSELIVRWGVPVEDAVRIVYDLAGAARDRGWDAALLPLTLPKEN